jgi:hypothetical protein
LGHLPAFSSITYDSNRREVDFAAIMDNNSPEGPVVIRRYETKPFLAA